MDAKQKNPQNVTQTKSALKKMPTEDEILQCMLNQNLIETRINRKTKEQEFQITHTGQSLLKILKFFNGEIS